MDEEPSDTPFKKPAAAWAPQPAELRWTMTEPDGTTLTCELHDHGQWGVEVQLARNAVFFFVRCYNDRITALIAANELCERHIREGGTLLTG